MAAVRTEPRFRHPADAAAWRRACRRGFLGCPSRRVRLPDAWLRRCAAAGRPCVLVEPDDGGQPRGAPGCLLLSAYAPHDAPPPGAAAALREALHGAAPPRGVYGWSGDTPWGYCWAQVRPGAAEIVAALLVELLAG
jgi:hypothetical protein